MSCDLLWFINFHTKSVCTHNLYASTHIIS